MGSTDNPRMPVKVPRGFRFSPTDSELLKYLECKVMAKPFPTGVIVDGIVDIYNPEYHPKTLIDRYGNDEKVVYVFTKLKKLTNEGTNFDRKVGGCTWKGNNRGKPVKDRKVVVGLAKTFSFVDQGKVNVGYIMKQLTLDESILQNASEELKDYALCQIYQKSKQSPSNDNFQEEEERVADSNFIYQHNQLPDHPEYDHRMKSEPIDAVPALVSYESLNHRPPFNELGEALQYGEQMRQEFRKPTFNVTQLEETVVSNAQQQQQDNAYDPQVNLYMIALDQEIGDQGILSLQQCSQLDPLPLNYYDHPPSIEFSASRDSNQKQLAPAFPFPPDEQTQEKHYAMLQASHVDALQYQWQDILTSTCNQRETESANAMANPSSSATLMRIDEPKPLNPDSRTLLTNDAVPLMVMHEALDHRPLENDLDATLQYGSQMKQDFSQPTFNVSQLDGMAIGNAQQEEEAYISDAEFKLFKAILDQDNDDQDMLSLQKCLQLDSLPLNYYDHQTLPSLRFSDFWDSPQENLAPLTSFPPHDHTINMFQEQNHAMIPASNMSALQDQGQYRLKSTGDQAEFEPSNTTMNPSSSATLMHVERSQPVNPDSGTLLDNDGTPLLVSNEALDHRPPVNDLDATLQYGGQMQQENGETCFQCPTT